MRVQHNIMAMNSYRNYNNNSSSINKNIEKLSSGYQINRAGDNAAGLAISEKMRAQITGLEVAQKNAKDGISLVQTAEGALTEVHSMLNRMYELAEQSANGTYSNEVDRAQLQKEVESLKTEIDRIADSANFNGTKLLNGDLSAGGAGLAGGGGSPVFTLDDSQDKLSALDLKDSAATGDVKMTIEANEDTTNATVKIKIGDTTYSSESIAKTDVPDTVTLTNDNDPTDSIEITLSAEGKTALTTIAGSGDDTNNITDLGVGSVAAGAGGAGGGDDGGLNLTDTDNIADIDLKDSAATGDVSYTIFSKGTGGDKATVSVKIGDTTYSADVSSSAATIELENTADSSDKIEVTLSSDAQTTLAGKITSYTDEESTATFSAKIGEVTEADASLQGGGANLSSGGKGPLSLQIGDDSNTWNQMKVSIDDIHVASLGKYTTNTATATTPSYKTTVAASGNAAAPTTISDIDISDQSQATVALNVIKEAINYVSDTRGGLGAIQNRLEHTINNLSVMQENMQDAESTIRDTDVAAEMMKYTKNSILVQSAQAMLAQANQQPQGVLQLLQ